MKCPFCGEDDDRVLDTRVQANHTVRRKRQCLSCNERFATTEEIEGLAIKVRKCDGNCQDFEKRKIRLGVKRALQKRYLEAESIEMLFESIERDIFKFAHNKREITSQEIGAIILENLLQYDQVAYIRFASVYKKFETIDEFVREINNIALNSHSQQPLLTLN